MRAKKRHILLALSSLFISSILYAQERPKVQPLNIKAEGQDTLQIYAKDVLTTVTDTTVTDTITKDTVKKPSYLQGIIDYKAKDYMRMSRKENKIYLYNEAEIYYQQYELKAGIIVIDYTTNEVYAGRIKDSTGEYTQTPYFKQGNNIIEPDSIRFNFDTKKALIFNSRSEQSIGETMNVFAETVKKENDSVYFLKEGKLTTSEDVDNPDYFIRIRKGKFVPNKKIIAGFSNMYIADVPTPIAVPFAYFPMSRDRRNSGIIMPTPGQTNRRGYSLQNGGYYFAISDYFDLALLGDYYTNGSYGFRTETNYAKRYKFRGALRFRYENNVTSQRGFPDYSQSTIYNIQWNHSQDAKASPNSRLSASVNFGSSKFYQSSLNQLNTPNFLNNTLQSSISYNKTFPGYPMVNLNSTVSIQQNTRDQSVNLTLPTFQGSMERIYPFAKRDGSKKGIFQNINFQYNFRAENRIRTRDTLLFKKEMFEDAKIGFQHTIPLTTNFKLFKFFSTSVGTNYNEVWQLKTIKRNDYDPVLDEATIDTLSGFQRYGTYNLNASVGTTLYGTFNFGEDKKIQAIRHTVRPSVSYGYTPAFDQYYDEYVDENGVQQMYTPFEGGIYGTPSLNNSNNIGLSLSNVVEAKVRDKDTTATEPKKVMLLNNLNFSTAYNIVADSLPWSPVRMSGGTQLFQNKMSVNFGATLDPYAIDNTGTRIDLFNYENGGSLFRMTSANMNVSYSINSKFFSSDKKDKEKTDNTRSGGRDDDLFGRAQDFSDERTFADEDEEETDEPTTAYAAKLPWDLRLAYSLTYSNRNRESEISNNSLMFSGNVDLTPQWKVGVSSGYDFKQKGFTYTQLRFSRDLKSFRLNFNWVPFSNRASWFFFIGIKSSMLSDLKWEKRSEPDRQL
ncbi:putative LPS assembly protein LptD [Galbibacter sp. EGI 63066]|uniref:putative LPS assembly protein LptD n=1 Tax=Galbibacter sp. EGI 63066 TaxID=2993559 RepID=UPI0022489E64|nr:putative LPS assembly protein LptD [Galbibacter sp. EGI 63066]MCX2681503.1 putative LPS assembly protein LptD [Galbibacter sp. EGI 63066]